MTYQPGTNTASPVSVSCRITEEQTVAETTPGTELEFAASLTIGSIVPSDLPSEDLALVDALRSGVDAAYEELIDRFQQPVYSLVYRLLDDPSEAPDVVQEIFIKVFRNVNGFRGNSSLKTWIYRIAYNEASNHRRWFMRHRRQEVGLEREDEEMPGFEETLHDHARSAFDLVSDRETMAVIEEALADINPAFRAAVILRDMEDLSYEEIADVLGVSLGTVKSRILRGREGLRKALTERLQPGMAIEWSPQPAR